MVARARVLRKFDAGFGENRAIIAVGRDIATATEALVMQRPANSPLSPKAAHALDLFFATEATGLNGYALRRAREAQFARLYALPDPALAAMGLSRDTLARWLFADLFTH